MQSVKDKSISLLRWSEKYTKTDMVYLFHGGFWLGLAQLAASLAGFVLTIALANLLTPEVFGEYRFLMAGLLILSIFALPGMRAALLESTPKGFLGNLNIAFKKMMQFGFIGSLVSILTALYYFSQGNIGLTIGFIVIAFALPFFDSSSVYLDYLKALKKFKDVSVYTSITRIFLLIVVVCVAFIFPQHAWIILGAFFLGNIVPALIFSRKTFLRFAKGQKTDTGVTHYAKHLTVMTALSLVAVQLDKIFIWNMVGAEELAIFYIAYAIPQETARFLQIIPVLAFPKFATNKAENVRKTLMPKVWKFFFLTSIITLIYIVTAPYIFSVLFPQYTYAIIYTQVLMCTTLAAAFSPISIYFTANKNTSILYFLSTIVPLVRILTAVLFIAFFDIWGAVWALLIEAMLRVVLLVYFFYKHDSVAPEKS